MPTFFRDKSTSGRIINISLLFGALGLLILAIVRAVTIPLTHDEALSLSKFAIKSIADIFSYQDAGGLPNNHILNTLWMKFASATFGESTLALRMGNIIGLILFLYAGLRLLTKVESPLLRVGGFLLLCCNPFLFDFFSLARGYGISNGFLLLSVWFLHEFRDRPSAKQSVKLFFAAGMMVLANLNAVHVFAAIASVVFVLNLLHKKPLSLKSAFQSALAPLIASAVLGAFLFLPFREILTGGGTFGGENGFWFDCVLELFNSSTYGASYAFTLAAFVPWLILIALVLLPIATVLYFYQKRITFLPIAVALVFIPALTTILQHQIFGSEFPVARTVLYLYVLFVVALITLAEATKYKVAIPTLLLASGILLLIHFSIAMQHNYAVQWAFDSGNRKVLDEVEKLKIGSQQERVTLGITWIYEPGLNYERNQRNYQWLSPLTQEGIANEYDYFYVCWEDSLTLSKRGKKVIAYYPESRTSLMK